MHGFCNSDVDGELAYVSPHGSSVMDTFIVSEDLFSDHCKLRVGNRVDSKHFASRNETDQCLPNW